MTSKPITHCGKKGCQSAAVARVYVTTELQNSAYVACQTHLERFAGDLRAMLELPAGAAWSIRIYGLVYSEGVI